MKNLKKLGILSVVGFFLIFSVAFAQNETTNETEINNETVPKEVKLPKAGTTPDSAFYGLERAWERVQLGFTFGEEAKVNKRMQFAEERLSEAREMANRNKTEYVDRLINESDDEMKEVRRIAEERNMTKVMERVSNATRKHIEVLKGVREKVPEQARAGIDRAINNSIRGHNRAVEAIKKSGNVSKRMPERINSRTGIPGKNGIGEEEEIEKGEEQVTQNKPEDVNGETGNIDEGSETEEDTEEGQANEQGNEEDTSSLSKTIDSSSPK